MKASKKDLKINMNGFLVGAENYDDLGAHKLLESLMLEQKKLWMKLTVDHWDYMCADIWIKGMKSFLYRLSQENFTKLLAYLGSGLIEDFQFDFDELEIQEEESFDLGFLIYQITEKCEKLKFTPFFQTDSDKIKATIYYEFGGIFFEVPRTQELIDLIKENGFSL